jgi:hypothetical protein
MVLSPSRFPPPPSKQLGDNICITVVNEMRDYLCHNVDFSNQSDRGSLGKALIKYVRDHGCRITSSKEMKCLH